jgi:hypothetical protein
VFGSAILEVAIGMIFVYLLVSVICSTIREVIEGWLKTRAAYLEYGIRELLHDRNAEGIVRSFYNHPLIFGLFTDEYKPSSSSKLPGILSRGRNLPSYIPAKNFALALMDMAARGPDTDVVTSDPSGPILSLESVRLNVGNLKNQALQRVLLSAIDAAQGDINQAQANIESWYNSGMDRVSGWYKRSTQWIIFAIGLLTAVGMNINTVTIADYLFRDETARAAIVARAEKVETIPGSSSANYSEVKQELESMNLPLGWSEGWGAPKRGRPTSEVGRWNNWMAPILGWLLTALAATMGAPFWFDMLNKVTVIRSTVKPHEKSGEEASEDRQIKKEIVMEGKAAGLAQPSLAAPVSAPLRPPQPSIPPTPRDVESGLDGCELPITSDTPDESLPPAQGGVA